MPHNCTLCVCTCSFVVFLDLSENILFGFFFNFISFFSQNPPMKHKPKKNLVQHLCRCIKCSYFSLFMLLYFTCISFQVFKSLKLFLENKQPGDELFDRLNVSLSQHASPLTCCTFYMIIAINEFLFLFTFSAATQMLVSKASSRFDLSVRLFKKGEETPPPGVIF